MGSMMSWIEAFWEERVVRGMMGGEFGAGAGSGVGVRISWSNNLDWRGDGDCSPVLPYLGILTR
jgi:hypothetical protein